MTMRRGSVGMFRCILFLGAVLCLGLTGSALQAQSPVPHLSVNPIYDAPRSQAPLQLEAVVNWPSQRVLEGYVQLDFYVLEEKAYTWISREVALSASEVRLPFMVPAAILPTDRHLLNVEASFHSASGVYKNELEINIQYWTDWKRVLVMGVVHPGRTNFTSSDFENNADGRFGWAAKLTLDELTPHREEWSRHISSRTPQMDPSSVPDHPLQLVEFDILLLTSDGLAGLNPAQLNAIADWVEAGGAVCAVGIRATTRPAQQFLRRISEFSADDPTLSFDSEGRIQYSGTGTPKWRLASPGVGRSLVTLAPVDLEDSDWRMAFYKLWRLRNWQMDVVKRGGKWVYPLPTGDFSQSLQNPSFLPLAPQSDSQLQLQTILMPEKIESLPMRTVILLLGSCLLLIGPGDYFLLGWLKRRRWTWLLFPAVALAYAGYTVVLAQSHIGSVDARRSLTIIDVAQEARAARTTRLKMLFSAAERVLDEELKNEFAIPLEANLRYGIDVQGNSYGSRGPQMSTAKAPSDIYLGRPPIAYHRIRALRQWETRLTRSTTLGPGEDTLPPQISWDQLKPAAMKDFESRQRLMQKLNDELSAPGLIVLLNQEQTLTSSDLLPETLSAAEKFRLKQFADIAVPVSRRGQDGLFRIVSQISPNASSSLEDLSLIDGTDPDQWLVLIVTIDDEGNGTVYRRLLRLNES